MPPPAGESADDQATAGSVVARAAVLLGSFDAGHSTLGVSELTRRSGLSKTTVARLAAELAEHQFLERTPEAKFRLGTALFALGELASRQRQLREVALPYMSDLRQVSRQTVHLAALAGTDVLYIEIVRSRDAPRMASRVGGRVPAHACAVGKALLAYSTADTVRAVIDHGLPAVGPRTITSPTALINQLRRIKAMGIAYEVEESGHGVGCVASPILSVTGSPIAALSITGRVGTLNLRRVGPAVKTAALALSRELTISAIEGPTE